MVSTGWRDLLDSNDRSQAEKRPESDDSSEESGDADRIMWLLQITRGLSADWSA